jgi:hypothetical protein
MRYKILFVFVFLILSFRNSYSCDSLNCRITFHFSNYTDTDYLLIAEQEPLFDIEFDTLKSSVICEKFSIDKRLPKTYLIIINNDIRNTLGIVKLNTLILHEGIYDVFVDIGKHKVSFKNSILNTNNQVESKVRDSLNSQIYFPTYVILRNEDNPFKVDSLKRILQREEMKISLFFYKMYLKDPTTYNSLKFISFYSKPFENNPFSKKQLTRLFKKLDSTLRQYKLYDDCKVALKIYTSNKKIKQSPVVKSIKSNLPQNF